MSRSRAGKSVGAWAQGRLVPSGGEPSGAAACPPELSGSPRRAGEGPPCQRRHGASRCRVSAGRGMEGAPPLKPRVHLHARYRRGRPSAGNLNLRRKAAAGTCLQYAPGIGAAGPPRARPPVIGKTAHPRSPILIRAYPSPDTRQGVWQVFRKSLGVPWGCLVGFWEIVSRGRVARDASKRATRLTAPPPPPDARLPALASRTTRRALERPSTRAAERLKLLYSFLGPYINSCRAPHGEPSSDPLP